MARIPPTGCQVSQLESERLVQIFAVGNIHFFEYPEAFLNNSKTADSSWIQRAWTYQEAVFSRLRLVFTDGEVYFDCLEGQGRECANFKFAKTEPLECLPRRCAGNRTNQLDIFEHISSFSERSLGHPEDIVRALAGVLHVFEVDCGVVHNWGIPVLPKHSLHPAFRWKPASAFFVGLQWTLRSFPYNCGTRKSFGPSWSWAGCKGAI